eukprot:Skav218443  [mRNA]  locus=scaffold905:59125:61836:+ [translate_table: standard]
METYMLSAGLKEQLLTMGFLATIHEVHANSVCVKLSSGENRTLHFDCSGITTVERTALLKQWRRILHRSYSRSAPVRFLGAELIAGPNFRLSESSILLEQAGIVDRKQLRFIELFSGGYGGWSRAVRWLGDRNYPVCVAGGVDIQPQMCSMWNANDATPDAPHAPRALNFDLNELTCWDWIMELQPNALTISSSCKAFSSAGQQLGWSSKDSSTLAVTLRHAVMFGFRLIVLENVANLVQDEGLNHFFRCVLEWSGLEVAHEQVVPLELMQPAERNRILMVLKLANDDEIKSIMPVDINELGLAGPHTLQSMDRWVNLPEHLVNQLTIDADVLKDYLSPKHMPKSMRQRMTTRSTAEAIEVRTVRKSMKMSAGTLMAAYGSQHKFGKTSRSGVILGQFREVHQNCFRFFHPCEHILAMGTTQPLTLPADFHWAMEAVGNSIAESHALFEILVAFQAWELVIPATPQTPIVEVLRQHRNDCMTGSNMKIDVNEQWLKFSKMMETDNDAGETPMIDVDRQFPCVYEIIQNDDEDEPVVCTLQSTGLAACRQIKDAEMQLHAQATQVSLMDELDNPIEDQETSPEGRIKIRRTINPAADVQPIIMITGPDYALEIEVDYNNPAADVQPIIMITGPDYALEIEVDYNTRLDDFKFHGIHARHIGWTQDDGTRYEPTQTILGPTMVWTQLGMNIPTIKSPGWVTLIHVRDKQISTVEVKHAQDQVVEDIMRAEQVLTGPDTRLVASRDRYANVIRMGKKLSEVQAVVMYWTRSHHQVKALISDHHGVRTRWCDKGTRIFQLIPNAASKIIVDENGVQLPRDLPLFRNETLKVLDHPDDDAVSPTWLFEIAAPTDTQKAKSTHDVTMVAAVTEASGVIRSQLAASELTSPNKALLISQRLTDARPSRWR